MCFYSAHCCLPFKPTVLYRHALRSTAHQVRLLTPVNRHSGLSTHAAVSGNFSTTVYEYPTTGSLNCSRLLTDAEYSADTAKERIAVVDPLQLDIFCEAIRARARFNERPLSDEESAYPIAYVRAVYKVRFAFIF